MQEGLSREKSRYYAKKMFSTYSKISILTISAIACCLAITFVVSVIAHHTIEQYFIRQEILQKEALNHSAFQISMKQNNLMKKNCKLIFQGESSNCHDCRRHSLWIPRPCADVQSPTRDQQANGECSRFHSSFQLFSLLYWLISLANFRQFPQQNKVGLSAENLEGDTVVYIFRDFSVFWPGL